MGQLFPEVQDLCSGSGVYGLDTGDNNPLTPKDTIALFMNLVPTLQKLGGSKDE